METSRTQRKLLGELSETLRRSLSRETSRKQPVTSKMFKDGKDTELFRRRGKEWKEKPDQA
ncbi:hypothetical protein P5673_002963 [Acropora cervicornis]|uniref:Uncharacterized protein n=1 Tax=Acropora cervicornis TaxID=6130 RepID=A0AAD9R245_ACRCE|nr:hypothetical protein P5673_002963 [Acropora cervicornis]